MSAPTRFLMTQSLLSSWLYQYKAKEQEKAHEEFLKTLRREHIPENQAMQDGIQFENMVTAYCDGANPPEGHKWEKGVKAVGNVVKGSQFQVALYRDTVIEGLSFLLYGRLDALKAGTIYDIKHSHAYRVGKYLDSPQHPMYFALCPEAREFVYLVSDGQDLYREIYRREETQPVGSLILNFIRYLEQSHLEEIFIKKWKARD